MADEFKNTTLPSQEKKYMTEEEVRELIASTLANWQGITRFRTIETTVLTLTDFTNSPHNHSNAANGGQITDSALSSAVTVPKGGTGANTLTGILKGNGASAVTTITQLAGTKTCFVATSSGGSPTTQITFTDGVLTAGL